MSEPKRGYMPLAELTAKYKPVHSDDWEGWWSDDFHATSKLIDSLVEELRANGRFDEPVILSEDETEVDEDTGEEYFYPASVSNGMHRLAAHWRTGIDPVFVQWGYKSSTPEELAGPELVLKVTDIADDGDDLDVWDELFETLSWRHQGPDRSVWLGMGFASGIGKFHEIWLSGAEYNVDNLEVMREDVTERLAGLATVLDLRWQHYDEDGEEIDPPEEQV